MSIPSEAVQVSILEQRINPEPKTIATAVLAHGNPEDCRDTVEGLMKFVTDQVIVLADGAFWERFKGYNLGVDIQKGFNHNLGRSPYRNQVLALNNLFIKYPDAIWYGYIEQDVGVYGGEFVQDLLYRGKNGVWALGADHRPNHDIWNWKELADISKVVIDHAHYLLGCVQFYHRDFFNKLKEIDFFERFMEKTKGYLGGFFPGYDLYAAEEDILPTMANALGGKVESLEWGQHYFLRFRPEVDFHELQDKPCLVHPLKNSRHPTREFGRNVRNYSMFPKTYEVVSVCPAGRRDTMKVLAYYLLQNRNLIDRHDWWINTTRADDIDYINKLCKKFPDFFKSVELATPCNDANPIARIHQFFKPCIDEETIYLRFDDDIIWMADDAISAILKFRLENTKPLVVYGNIINNTICTHLHHRLGMIQYKGMFPHYGLLSENAFRLGLEAHEGFLKAIEEGTTDRYKFYQWIMHHWDGGYSVDAICWFGHDLKLIDGNVEHSDENFLSVEWIKRTGRYNSICGKALFSHLSYKPQRDWNMKFGPVYQGYVSLIENQDLYKELDCL